MKKPYFYLNIFVAIVATMLAACNVGDIDISIVPNTPTVTTLNFSSNMESDESARTAYNDGTIVWSTGDQIRMAYTVNDIWQNAMGNSSDGKAKFYVSNQANTNEECTRATFSIPGHFESNDGGTHQFYVLYPSKAVSSPDIDAPYADVEIKNTQTASATTFDKDADIMIGRSVETYEALPTNEQIRLIWNRLVAHGFITLTNLDAVGESVNSVTLTAANGTKLTGTYPINITNGEIDEAKEAHNNVTLQFNETTIGDDKKLPFWFCSLPFETNYIKVEVDTEHYTFCREITLEGKTLNFQQNKRNTLAINMTDAVRTAKTAGVNATDVIDCPFTGVTTTSYTDWTNTSISSGATYKGQSATKSKNQEYVQLKSKDSTSGIVTTKSAGKVSKVIVVWDASNSAGRTLDIYGKNTAYSAASDLYNTNTQGKKLGSIVMGTSTELAIEGDYAFIGLRSNDGAMYLEAIYIVWGEGSLIPLQMSDITCSAQTETSLTFSWSEVANATGYKVSTDNSNWVDANGNLSHTLSDLTAGAEYTLYVKAIAAEDSIFTDSEAKSAKGTTSAAQGGGESGVAQYVKVTSTTDITSGTYLIVYEAKAYVFNGGLATTSIDAAGNYKSVTISNNTIESNATTDAMAFVYDASNKSFKGVGGAYIGRTSDSNGMDEHATTVRTHSSVTISNGNAIITSSGGPNLQFYDSGSNSRFRYYSSTQKAIQLYKLTGGNGGSDTPATPTQLDTPSVTASASGNTVTVTWDAITGAKDYTVKCGSSTQTVTTSSASFSGLTYSTSYNVSVVANPSDATANTASEAGTATFTTGADPNAGGSGEKKTYTLTITKDSFNGASYSANNSEKTSTATATDGSTMEVKWTSNQVMLQNEAMQWQKNNGYIYNSTDLGTITNIKIDSTSGTFTPYKGSSAQPTSNGAGGYFQIKVGSSVGSTSKVTITFEK